MSTKAVYKILSAIAIIHWPLSDIHDGPEPNTYAEYKAAIKNILKYLQDEYK